MLIFKADVHIRSAPFPLLQSTSIFYLRSPTLLGDTRQAMPEPTNDPTNSREAANRLSLTQGVVITDQISRGSTGRLWHLPFDGTVERESNKSPNASTISISVPIEGVVVRRTCEFLREHSPQLYRNLWSRFKADYPIDPNFPQTTRVVREVIHPNQSFFQEPTPSPTARDGNALRKAPFSIDIPSIGADHWAYQRHLNPGHFITPRSGNLEELSRQEAASDVGSILSYISRYSDLAKDIKGKNLWSATHDPDFRAPYFTCMELCVGELQIPSHFLSLIHYGIGLHFMHEQSLPWDRKLWRNYSHKQLHETLKESFRELARLYREDFGVRA
jgi:hypothetical protein